jgi:hypothetical protein
MEENMNTSPDLSDVKIDGDHIEIEVDGVVVTGKILERRSGDITVTITSPNQGVTQQSGNVPIPLRQFRNYSGPHGTAKAAEILADLYKFCVYKEEHKRELLVTLTEFEQAVHHATYLDPITVSKKLRMDAIAGELLEIKQSFRSGSIDHLAYQRQIRPLKKEMENLAFETNTDFEQLFWHDFKAFEAEIDIREVFMQSFIAYEDTPVWKIRPENVIPHLNALRESEV